MAANERQMICMSPCMITSLSKGLHKNLDTLVRCVGNKLKSRYGARNRFQEPSVELSRQAT
jgi:hypothetical protein